MAGKESLETCGVNFLLAQKCCVCCHVGVSRPSRAYANRLVSDLLLLIPPRLRAVCFSAADKAVMQGALSCLERRRSAQHNPSDAPPPGAPPFRRSAGGAGPIRKVKI